MFFSILRRVGWRLALLGLSSLVHLGSAQDPATTEAVTAWLKDDAIRLASTSPGQAFSDLRPFKQSLRGVRLVGLGEATHGTHEFFTLKHRLLEFLVTELGVTTFLIEASYPASLAVNDYVLYGQGDPAEALSQLGFWMWDTEEVSTLIAWMRAYNRAVPEAERVRFVGFDFQHSEAAMGVVTSFLARALPAAVEDTEATFAAMREGERVTRDATTSARVLPELRRLVGRLERERGALIRATSPEDYERSLLHARVLLQHADAFSDPRTFVSKRNRFMAENIRALLSREAPGTRAALWAHNEHVGTSAGETGAYLREWLGGAYYALGFAFDRGGFHARDPNSTGYGPLKVWQVDAATEGVLEWYFAQVGAGNFLIDFRRAPQDALVRKWLATPGCFRMAGCIFSEETMEGWRWWRSCPRKVSLIETFDGVAFVEKTTPSRLNLPGAEIGPRCTAC